MFGFIKKIVLFTLCVGLLLPAYVVRASGCVSGNACTLAGSSAHRAGMAGYAATAPVDGCLSGVFGCCRFTADPAAGIWAVPSLTSFQPPHHQHHPALSSEAPQAASNLPPLAEFQDHLRARPGFAPLYLQHAAILC